MKDQEYKDALLIAIDDYPKFRPLRKKILKFIVGCLSPINNTSTINPLELVKKFNITKATAYGHLKALKQNGIIISLNEEQDKFTTFRLDRMKADDILAAYSTKKDYLDKI